LVKKYEKQRAIPEDDARCIILIMWLLTDANTEKADLNITKFEKWSWQPIDNILSNSRCAVSSLLLQNDYAYDSWMRLVQIAWKSIESKQSSIEKPAETEQKTTLLRRIWTSVKKIPQWIYVFIIFLAALLTIFYYLGWLEPIKAFIHRIFSPD